MERNNLLVKRIMLLIVSGVLTVFSSCSKLPPLMMEDLVGVWKSQYDEILILNKDSTFTVENFKTEHLYRKISNEKVNGQGKWEIKRENKEWILQLEFSVSIKDDIKESKVWNYPLYIGGSGLLGNKFPWTIRSWYDDPDFSLFGPATARSMSLS